MLSPNQRLLYDLYLLSNVCVSTLLSDSPHPSAISSTIEIAVELSSLLISGDMVLVKYDSGRGLLVKSWKTQETVLVSEITESYPPWCTYVEDLDTADSNDIVGPYHEHCWPFRLHARSRYSDASEKRKQ